MSNKNASITRIYCNETKIMEIRKTMFSTNSGITIARIADGKVIEETDFADDLGLMTQLGATPAEGK